MQPFEAKRKEIYGIPAAVREFLRDQDAKDVLKKFERLDSARAEALMRAAQLQREAAAARVSAQEMQSVDDMANLGMWKPEDRSQPA